MTKIYLNKNLSIVLTIITALLSFVYIYYTYTLYGISQVQVEALQDPGFKYKFVETVVYALVWLSLSGYFIIKTMLDKPLVELRFDEDFVYEEVSDEISDEVESTDAESESDSESK